MGISQEKAIAALFPLFLCGCFAGGLYDIIRILRVIGRLEVYSPAACRLEGVAFPLIGAARPDGRRMRHPAWRQWLIFAGDVLFFLVAGALFSIYLAHFADGVFRWFFLLAFGAGFGVYMASVGRLVVYVSEWIAAILRLLGRYLLWFLFCPFRGLIRCVGWARRWAIRRIWTPMYTRQQLRRLRRYTHSIQMGLPASLRLDGEGSDGDVFMEG